MNPLKELAKYGQAPGLDYIRRSLISSGELKRHVEDDGLRGITSNHCMRRSEPCPVVRGREKVVANPQCRFCLWPACSPPNLAYRKETPCN